MTPHPIIVLEGPDGGGKTTLAKHLKEKWGGKIYHMTYRWPREKHFQYHHAVLECAIRTAHKMPVIIDRAWPSVNIYDMAYRGGCATPMLGRMMDRAMMPQGVVYVGCLPWSQQKKWMEDFAEKKARGEEMYNSLEGLLELYSKWNDYMSGRPDYVVYDRFEDGQDLDYFTDKLSLLSFFLQSQIPTFFQRNRQYGGSPYNRDKLLIVGEKSNPKHHHRVWPFFEYGNSSLWLSMILTECCIDERDITWANALNEEGWANPPELRLLYEHIRPKHIVALGGKAQKVLASANIDSIQLPHPAYVKRFQHGDPTEYVEAFTQMEPLTWRS